MGRRARPHLLLVAFYFPPARASGVFRARAIANHLVRRGWDVTVLTADSGFFTDVLRQSDPSLLATVDPAVRVERAPFTGRRLDRDLRRHGWFRGNFPKQADRALQRIEERRFPDAYAPWIRPAVTAAVRLHADDPIDVVLATGNPFSSFEVARQVSEQAGTRWVVDYRDSWTLDQFSEEAAYPPESRVWAAEARVLESADRIVFVNHAQRSWYADRYEHAADRMIVVENGYDAELLEVPADAGGSARPEPVAGLRLGYVGTITRHLPWDVLFAAWEQVRDEPELADAEIDLYGYFGFFGHSANSLASLIPTGGSHRVNYRGPLPKEQVGRAYDDLDVLLLVTPDSRYVTCQKVYEYMAAAKPIVSVNHPRTDARTPLEGYPLAFNVDDLTPEAVAKQLLRAAGEARSPQAATIAHAREHARRYERGRRLETLERELKALLDA